MATAMITGAGGFLGSHVLEQILNSTDWDVVVVDSFRHNGGTDRILQAMIDVPGTGEILDDTKRRVRLCTHDLAAPFSAQQFADLGDIDYVVHAAAQCSVDHSLRHPVEHVTNNIQSTLTMLEAAVYLKPARYIHVSTDEVFGSWHVDQSKADLHNPSSPYAASKAASEDLTKAWARSFGVPAVIINSCNLFGPRQSQAAFIPATIGKLLRGEPITIHTTSSGRAAHRWYNFAPDVAAHLVTLLAEPNPQSRQMLTGVLGTGMAALTETLAGILDVDYTVTLVPGKDARPGFDPSYGKLPDQPGWAPETLPHVALEATVAWYLDHPGFLR